MALLFRPSVAAILVAIFLAGCASDRDLAEPVVPIGAFKLGHNIVVADGVQKVEPSRDVSADEWEAAMKAAIDRRFSRYQGDQFYHIAVAVEGYSVAVTGIPLVVTPKSVVILSATIWDDAAGGKINKEPERFTILESLGGNTFVGSGATMTKEEQVAQLAANAARRIEAWMRKNEHWFAQRAPGETPVLPDATPQ